MVCKNCKIYHTDNFNHVMNYCEEIDCYVVETHDNCPCFKQESKFEKLKRKIISFYYKKCNKKHYWIYIDG